MPGLPGLPGKALASDTKLHRIQNIGLKEKKEREKKRKREKHENKNEIANESEKS